MAENYSFDVVSDFDR